MALITCSECGKEMSDKAVSCPHCGCPNPAPVTETVSPEIITPEAAPSDSFSSADSEFSPVAESAPVITIDPPKKKKTVPILIGVAAVAVICILISVLVPKNPIKQLNSKETLVYDNLIIGLEHFYNQNAASVLECGTIDTNEKGIQSIKIKIQGQNKLGGTLTHVYNLTLSGDKAGTMLSMSDIASLLKKTTTKEFTIDDSDPDINVGKLNKALARHWEDMGLTNNTKS